MPINTNTIKINQKNLISKWKTTIDTPKKPNIDKIIVQDPSSKKFKIQFILKIDLTNCSKKSKLSVLKNREAVSIEIIFLVPEIMPSL